MTTGERIKQIREEKGLTQTDLAKIAGYTDKTSISKIENAGDNISTKTAVRIAKALNCDYKELFGWLEDTTPADMTVEEVKMARRLISYATMLSEDNAMFISKIEQLSKEARDRINNMLDYEIEQERKKRV